MAKKAPKIPLGYVIIGLFAAAGLLFLAMSFAATGDPQLEAEKSNDALAKTDSGASDGKYLHFAATSTGGPNCDGLTKVDISPPASDLNNTVAGRPENTCFFLKNGNYNFHDVKPKNGMKFIGESKTGVVVDGNGYENAFSGNNNNVTIANFTLKNYNNLAGHKAQQQAPIRGTTGIWQTGSGNLASGWVIENMVIHNNSASAIFAGNDFIIKDNTLHTNGITGIGGEGFAGGIFENNVIYNNGFNTATGSAQNGANVKITVVNFNSSKQTILRGNKVYDGEIGIWADVKADRIIVENNTVYDHKTSGIMCEVSKDMTIRGNTVTDSSTWGNWNNVFNNGAIGVGECGYVTVENNTVNGGVNGIAVRQTKRPHDQFEVDYFGGLAPMNLTTHHVTVKNNTVNNSQAVGASHASSAGGLMDYSTISFTGNTYNGVSQFWWNGSALTYSQWQAAGRQ